MPESDGECPREVRNRAQAGWRRVSGAICD